MKDPTATGLIHIRAKNGKKPHSYENIANRTCPEKSYIKWNNFKVQELEKSQHV